MISNYDVIKYLEKHKDLGLIYQPETKDIFDKSLNRVLCTLDEFTQKLRVANHCDFECIYSCHPTLDVVLRCKQCGTVIFTGDDERYDPNLRCPTCGDYHTYLTYYTKEDIENDENKRREIDMLIEMEKESVEYNKRIKRRHGLLDHEIFKKKFYGKIRMLEISLCCSNLFKTGLKGLYLHLSYFKKDNREDFAYTSKWFKNIPLSLHSLKIQRMLKNGI